MFKPQNLLIVFLGILGLFSLFLVIKGLSHTPEPLDFAVQIDRFRNEGVPSLNLSSIDPVQGKETSQRFNLEEVSADVILVNFWASWCTPCIAEYPSLIELSNKFKNNPKFLLVA